MWDVVVINPAAYAGTPRRGPYELEAFRNELANVGFSSVLLDFQADVGARRMPYPAGHLEAVRTVLREYPAHCYLLTSRTTAGPWVVEIAKIAKDLTPSSKTVVYAPRIEERVARTVARGNGIDFLLPASDVHSLGVFFASVLSNVDPAPLAMSKELDMREGPALHRNGVGPIWVSPDQTIAAIQVGRGCPDRCTFCAAPLGSGAVPTYASAEDIVAAAQRAYNQLPSDRRLFVMLETENLTSNAGLIIDIVRLRSEMHADFRWGCYGRIDHMNSQMQYLLKHGGCAFIFFGLELSSPRVRKVLGKGYDGSKVLPTIEALHSYGIITQSSFIFGTPGETFSDFVDTALQIAEVIWLRGFVDWTPLRIEAGSALERMTAKLPLQILPHSDLFIDLKVAGLDPASVDADAGYRMYGLELPDFDVDLACLIARRWCDFVRSFPLFSYILIKGLNFDVGHLLSSLSDEMLCQARCMGELLKAYPDPVKEFALGFYYYELKRKGEGTLEVANAGITLLYDDLRVRPALIPPIFNLPWWGSSGVTTCSR